MMAKQRRQLPAMDRLAAHLLEMQDEELAPAAQRMPVMDRDGNVLREPLVDRLEWVDPDDNNPNRRTAKKVSGFQRYDVLRRIALTNADITDQHLDAAERLARDWEMASGGGGGGLAAERVDAVASVALPPIMAMTRYRNAVRAMGDVLASVLLPVVLENVTLFSLSQRFRMSRKTLRKWLVEALDKLVEHYGL